MRRITVVPLLFIIQSFCFACPDAMPPVAFDSSDIHQQSCEIRFGVLHKLMMVDATINNITGYLCIDTGIKGLILNEQFFYGVRRNTGIMNSGGDIISSESSVADVKLGSLTRAFPDARTANLHHIFQNESKLVLGMIGWKIFDRNEILIDYLNARIIIYTLDEEGNRIEKSEQFNPIANSTSLKFTGEFPIITAEVGDEKLNLILDSGATSNVMCKSLFLDLKSNNVQVRKVRSRLWGGASANLTLTKFAGLQIGNITLLPMKTLWYSLDSFNHQNRGPEIHGIIGQELFKQYQVGINFQKNIITLYSYKKDLFASPY